MQVKALLSGAVGLAEDVFHALFPASCPVCGNRLLKTEGMICATCLSHLPLTHFKGESRNPIEMLLADLGERFIRANSFLFYRKGAGTTQAIFEFKYRNNPRMGVYMGELMAQDLLSTGFFDGIEAIVPLPLAPKRMRQRGYNQSEMLARGIARLTHLPIVTNAVVRKHFKNTQTHLSKSEREENVEGAFSVVHPEGISGKHILVVDDVITFGYTLRSCIGEILKVEGTRVSAVTLCTAYKKSLDRRVKQNYVECEIYPD